MASNEHYMSFFTIYSKYNYEITSISNQTAQLYFEPVKG